MMYNIHASPSGMEWELIHHYRKYTCMYIYIYISNVVMELILCTAVQCRGMEMEVNGNRMESTLGWDLFFPEVWI